MSFKTLMEASSRRKILRPTIEQVSQAISSQISDPYRIEEIISDDLLNFSRAVQQALSVGHTNPLEDYFFNKLKKEVREELTAELNIP